MSTRAQKWGAHVSVLDSGSNDLGSSSGWVHCTVFFVQDTLFSHCSFTPFFAMLRQRHCESKASFLRTIGYEQSLIFLRYIRMGEHTCVRKSPQGDPMHCGEKKWGIASPWGDSRAHSHALPLDYPCEKGGKARSLQEQQHNDLAPASTQTCTAWSAGDQRANHL